MRCSLAVLFALGVSLPALAQVAEVKSPDQRLIATAKDKGISISDAASGKELRLFVGHTDKVTALAFSPDGKGLLSGGADNTMLRWDLATGKLIWKVQAGNPITSLKCSADGKTVILERTNQTRLEYDLATGKLLREIRN